MDRPPPYRQTPEEEAEDERIRAECAIQHVRLDAILAGKRANAAERARIKALAREDRIQSQAPTDADVWC